MNSGLGEKSIQVYQIKLSVARLKSPFNSRIGRFGNSSRIAPTSKPAAFGLRRPAMSVVASQICGMVKEC